MKLSAGSGLLNVDTVIFGKDVYFSLSLTGLLEDVSWPGLQTRAVTIFSFFTCYEVLSISTLFNLFIYHVNSTHRSCSIFPIS